MSRPAPSAMIETLSRIDDGLRHVHAWADAFKALGEGGSQIEPMAILVMGNALDTLVGVLRDQCEAAHKLATQ